MMARRGVLWVLAGASALLTGCSLNPDDMGFLWQKPYYAKLKVEVDTPQGVKSGASVIEVTWDKANKGFKVRGEAVAVDLPGGQTVFALLRSKSSVDWAAYLHENVKLDGPIETHEELYRKVAADRRVWPVKRRAVTAISDVDNYPYFVRFKDTADPKSVEQIDPDNLAKSFGAGYQLKSLTVQMTGEPVTSGIEKRLSPLFWKLWGAIHKSEMEKGSVNSNPYFETLFGQLTRDDFIKEPSQ
jgi:hypothetical protein